MQPRPASATPVLRTAADAMDTGGPQVCDDMTVEVALSVLVGARTGHPHGSALGVLAVAR
ncbi:hypothetical protein ACFYNK_00305 [Streptomyces niveus]|uniref:hypothetical protein n=1 Tax=Streptomyces niveus TaxID=193462 RepID=UPI00367B328D